MRRPRRVDENQPGIVAAFRKCGASVEVLSDVGRGVPDLLISYRGETVLVEIKMPGEKLTDMQRQWRGRWRGVVYVVTDRAEVPEVLKEMVKTQRMTR